MAFFDSIDPDDLPEEPQPDQVPCRTIFLWLVVVSLAIFLLPLYLISTTLRRDADRLQAELTPIQATIDQISTPGPEAQALMATLTGIQNLSREIQQVHPTLVADHVDWSAVASAISNYSPDQLSLTLVTQEANRITLNGRAVNDTAVVAYADALEASNLFDRVLIQSVQSIATPFATPTSVETGTPGVALTPTGVPTITATPTPDPRDPFETDDFQFKAIALGQPQSHNFYPIYDVDNVKFLAKAGRHYRVFTFDLSPGVDTFLTVSLGGTVYTNDDRQAGELASEVLFQAGSRDVEALVKITNRGQYGPDTWYQIAVEEVIPTPTPTPTDTPPPTATSLPIPTATPTPTPVPPNTPTWTPDLRDEYEPDDTAPQPIAVGEQQTHNFYPDGDVDRVNFVVKAGRYYQVLTSDLALGVDTFLSVVLGEERWENDDYAPPGTGNFASAVCLQAAADGLAEAIITNRNPQYGPDKRYDIGVHEAPVLGVTPTTLHFGPVVEGGANPASQQVFISGTGDDVLDWTAETDDEWLSVNPASDTAPSALGIAVDTTGLIAGDYTGSVVISGTTPCTQNTPQTITVTLQIIAPAARRPGLAARFPDAQALHRLPALEAVDFVIVLELRATNP